MKRIKFKHDSVLTDSAIRGIRSRKTWFVKYLVDDKEKKLANELIRKYLDMSNQLTLGQFELIKDLVYQEIMQFRTEQGMKGNSDHLHVLMESLCKLTRRIDEIKKRLNIVPK